VTKQTKIEYEDWMNRKWRPTVAWTYIVTCVFDFILFPIFWAVYSTTTGNVLVPWDPLTLKGAGLYHMAMGAILGITAWSRGQEKIQGAYASSSSSRSKPQLNDDELL
jgi:hypothetical protein